MMTSVGMAPQKKLIIALCTPEKTELERTNHNHQKLLIQIILTTETPRQFNLQLLLLSAGVPHFLNHWPKLDFTGISSEKCFHYFFLVAVLARDWDEILLVDKGI